MTTQSLDLNLIPKGISPRLYVSQYDKGQTWTFNIYAGNTAYTIPNGATVTIQGTKPDKTGFQYSCTASGNVVTATEQQQMTVIAGEVPAEIRITNNNEIIATLNFILVVEPAALTDETEISETDLPIIEQAIEMFPHYQEMIDEVSSDIATLSNLRAKLGAHNLGKKFKNGITYRDLTMKDAPDGGNYVNGTATGSGGRLDLRSDNFVLKAGTYTIVGESNDHSKYSMVVLQKTSDNSVLGAYIISNASVNKSSASVTLAADTECYFGFNTNNGTAYGTDTFIIYPMVKLADDKDDTFYPYSKPNTELTKDDSGLTANAFANGAVNLFRPSMSSQVANGVTYVVNDDYTISTSGTASEATMLSIGSYIYKAGRYKISGCPTGGSSSSYCLRCIAMKDGSPTWIKTVDDTGNGCELEIDGTTVDKINIAFIITNGTNMNGKVFKPMVTLADMPNSDYAHYVPYCKSNKELTKLWNANKYVEQAINWESNVDTYYDRTNIVAHFRVNEFTRHCILDVTDLVTKFTMNAGEVSVLFNVGGSFIPFVNERKDVPILKKDSTYYNGFVTKASSHNGVSFTAKESIPSGTSITFTLDWFY